MSGRSMSAKIKKEGFFARLQPRERVLVTALIGTALVMFSFVLFYYRFKRISQAETEIEALKEGIDMTYGQGPGLTEAKGEDPLAALGTRPVVFSSLLEEASSRTEISATQQEVQPAQDVGPSIRATSVEFDLRGGTLDQITKFLAHIEGKNGSMVLTTGLRMTSPSAEEDSLNAKIEMTAWERTDRPEQDESGTGAAGGPGALGTPAGPGAPGIP